MSALCLSHLTVRPRLTERQHLTNQHDAYELGEACDSLVSQQVRPLLMERLGYNNVGFSFLLLHRLKEAFTL